MANAIIFAITLVVALVVASVVTTLITMRLFTDRKFLRTYVKRFRDSIAILESDDSNTQQTQLRNAINEIEDALSAHLQSRGLDSEGCDQFYYEFAVGEKIAEIRTKYIGEEYYNVHFEEN
jgi:hypothetical protein